MTSRRRSWSPSTTRSSRSIWKSWTISPVTTTATWPTAKYFFPPEPWANLPVQTNRLRFAANLGRSVLCGHPGLPQLHDQVRPGREPPEPAASGRQRDQHRLDRGLDRQATANRYLKQRQPTTTTNRTTFYKNNTYARRKESTLLTQFSSKHYTTR